jgi:hypothetical protein
MNSCSWIDGVAVEQQDQSNPFRNYTVPARLIIIAALLGGPIGAAIFICCIYDELPPGSYPILFFAFPVLLGMFFFVLIGFRLLRHFGVPVYIHEIDRRSESSGKKESQDQEVGS